MRIGKFSISTLVCLILVSMMFLFSGCESCYNMMSASPAPVTNFIPESYQKKLELQQPSFPFKRLWYEKDARWGQYKKIKIMPVDISHVMEASWWGKVNETSVTDMKKDLQSIGDYMRKDFIDALKNSPHCKVKVVDTVDDETLVMYMALTELVPTKVFFNAIGTTAGFFIPGASLINVFNAGSVAMEAKIEDPKTEKIVVVLTGNEKDEGALLDIQAYSWYSHSRSIIDNWAAGFAELASGAKIVDVSKPFPFSFIAL